MTINGLPGWAGHGCRIIVGSLTVGMPSLNRCTEMGLAMRVEEKSGSIERRVVVGMVTDAGVLGRIAPKWDRDEGMFASKWANLVGGWCCKYFEKYGKAPGNAIQGIYESWATSKQRDEDTTALVEKFLKAISGEYEAQKENANTEYTLDQAGELFNKVKMTKLAETIQGHLDLGKPEDARKLIEGFGKVELGAGAGVDIMSDEAAWQTAFEHSSEPIIQYPGALGEFFGDSLGRDCFVAFMAKEKGGKTFWMMDLAFRAMCQRRRVAFFQVGDLSQSQIMHRWGIRAAKHPRKPGRVRIPIAIERGDEDHFAKVPEYKEKVFETGLTWKQAYNACQEITKRTIKSDESYCRVSVHPSDTINVHGIRGIIAGWERAGWVPDVVIVDYADILAPPLGAEEGRHQINKTWMQLRSLSTQLHCLVVTATQADAASYTADTLGRRNFSEDKRKYAHVTATIGINATDEEKEAGISRLNFLVLREEEFIERRCVHVGGSLGIANPAIVSCK